MGNTGSEALDASQLGQLTDEQISAIVARPADEFDDPMKYVLRDYFLEKNFVWMTWRSPPDWGFSMRYPSTWKAEPFAVSTLADGPFQGTVVGTQKFGDIINAEISIKRYYSAATGFSSSSSTDAARSMSLAQYTAISIDEVNTMNEHMDGKYLLNEDVCWRSLNLPAHRVQVVVLMDEDDVQLESVSDQQWAIKDNVVYQLIVSYPRSCSKELAPIVQKMIDSCQFQKAKETN